MFNRTEQKILLWERIDELEQNPIVEMFESFIENAQEGTIESAHIIYERFISVAEQVFVVTEEMQSALVRAYFKRFLDFEVGEEVFYETLEFFDLLFARNESVLMRPFVEDGIIEQISNRLKVAQFETQRKIIEVMVKISGHEAEFHALLLRDENVKQMTKENHHLSLSLMDCLIRDGRRIGIPFDRKKMMRCAVYLLDQLNDRDLVEMCLTVILDLLINDAQKVKEVVEQYLWESSLPKLFQEGDIRLVSVAIKILNNLAEQEIFIDELLGILIQKYMLICDQMEYMEIPAHACNIIGKQLDYDNSVATFVYCIEKGVIANLENLIENGQISVRSAAVGLAEHFLDGPMLAVRHVTTKEFTELVNNLLECDDRELRESVVSFLTKQSAYGCSSQTYMWT